jgi:hypothetical protein
MAYPPYSRSESGEADLTTRLARGKTLSQICRSAQPALFKVEDVAALVDRMTSSHAVSFDGNRFNRTAATAPLFNYLAPSESADEKVVSHFLDFFSAAVTIWSQSVELEGRSSCPRPPEATGPNSPPSFPQFLVGDVQVSLGLLNARVTEHQPDHADVQARGQKTAGTLMPQVVPPTR